MASEETMLKDKKSSTAIAKTNAYGQNIENRRNEIMSRE
jgi:hypothetical protein